MKSAIWLTFDLGVRGDYETLYTWLDQRLAKECGDNVAFLTYEYSGNLLDELKKDIEDTVEFTKKSRLYVIYRDAKSKKLKGSFLTGGRKAPPWSGYAVSVQQADADEG